MTIQQKLLVLADEFDRDAKQFPNYSCIVLLPINGIGGPMIPPLPYDEATMIHDEWELCDKAWREFKRRAELLCPLLQATGATLITGDDATPAGSVLYWAMGNEHQPSTRKGMTVGGVASLSNTFRLVAVAIRQFVAAEPAKTNATTNGADDQENYVEANKLYGIDERVSNWDEMKAFLKIHPEISHHPKGRRRMVHSSQFLKAIKGPTAFDRLDDAEPQSLFGDGQLFIDEAADRLAEIRKTKAAKK